jgi:hypothetical protein
MTAYPIGAAFELGLLMGVQAAHDLAIHDHLEMARKYPVDANNYAMAAILRKRLKSRDEAKSALAHLSDTFTPETFISIIDGIRDMPEAAPFADELDKMRAIFATRKETE